MQTDIKQWLTSNDYSLDENGMRLAYKERSKNGLIAFNVATRYYATKERSKCIFANGSYWRFATFSPKNCPQSPMG